MSVDLSQEFEKDKEEYGFNAGGSDFFEIEEGENKIRVLSKPEIIVERFGFGTCYKGAKYCQPDALQEEYEALKSKAIEEGRDPEKVKIPKLTYRYMCWLLSRKDNKMYIYKMPLTVFKQLAKLQKTEDYEFDDFPMPYDITLTVEDKGKTEVKYQIIPRAKHTELTERETELFGKQTPVADIIERMKEKARKVHEGSSMNEVINKADEEAPDPADIPF